MITSLFENNKMNYVMKRLGVSIVKQILAKHDAYIFLSEHGGEDSDESWYKARNHHDAGDTKAVEEISHLLFASIWNYIVKYDPSDKKKFMLWLVKTYASGGINHAEDFSRARDALETFMDMSKRRVFQNNPELKQYSDINVFKTLPELEMFIRKVTSDGTDKKSQTKTLNTKIAQYAAQGVIRIVLDNDEYLAIELPSGASEASADMFKQATAWCTARDGSRWFESYAKQGPLYPILNKKTGHLMQAHFETNSFLDSNDMSIDDDLPVAALEYIYNSSGRDENFVQYAAQNIPDAIYTLLIQNKITKEDIKALLQINPNYIVLKDDVEPRMLLDICASTKYPFHKIIAYKHPELITTQVSINMVKKDFRSYDLIKDPSPELNKFIIRQNVLTADHLRNVDDALIDWVINSNTNNFKTVFPYIPDRFSPDQVMEALRFDTLCYRSVEFKASVSDIHKEHLPKYQAYMLAHDPEILFDKFVMLTKSTLQYEDVFKPRYPRKSALQIGKYIEDFGDLSQMGDRFSSFVYLLIRTRELMELFNFTDTQLDKLYDMFCHVCDMKGEPKPFEYDVTITELSSKAAPSIFSKYHFPDTDFNEALEDHLITHSAIFGGQSGLYFARIGSLSPNKVEELKTIISDGLTKLENTISDGDGAVIVSKRQDPLNEFYAFVDRDIDVLVEIVRKTSVAQYEYYNDREFLQRNRSVLGKFRDGNMSGSFGSMMSHIISQLGLISD